MRTTTAGVVDDGGTCWAREAMLATTHAIVARAVARAVRICTYQFLGALFSTPASFTFAGARLVASSVTAAAVWNRAVFAGEVETAQADSVHALTLSRAVIRTGCLAEFSTVAIFAFTSAQGAAAAVIAAVEMAT